MDAAHIDMQVLSLTSPGTEQLKAAEATVLARDTILMSPPPAFTQPKSQDTAERRLKM